MVVEYEIHFIFFRKGTQGIQYVKLTDTSNSQNNCYELIGILREDPVSLEVNVKL